jgi:hypothetical protein
MHQAHRLYGKKCIGLIERRGLGCARDTRSRRLHRRLPGRSGRPRSCAPGLRPGQRALEADGFIAAADTRYRYDFWRPVTAIRAGDTDGNDATTPDPAWESYVNTPPMPDYPSTHSVLGAAAAAVMTRFFGTDGVAFTMTSGAPFAGITRSFTSFSQAARENAESRIPGGIHFRSACENGLALGESIGRRAMAHRLQRYQP